MSDRGWGDSGRPGAARAPETDVARAADSGERVAAPVSERVPAPSDRVAAPVSERVAADRAPDSLNRRSSHRIAVTWSVDCETDDTFLYASITNISEMGIFVRTTDPLAVGTSLKLRFAPPGSGEAFVLEGVVQWINLVRPLWDNPNPGMGIRFENLGPDDRERIVRTIRTIAYVRDDVRPPEPN
jgi:type IV pilus assembly protein PilZ